MSTYVLFEEILGRHTAERRVRILKQYDPTQGKIRRLETREDGFEQHYWVSPDWFENPANLEAMTEQDLGKNINNLQQFLTEAKQAHLEGKKRGAPKEELDKLHEPEHNLYWTRRHLQREVKRRELDFLPAKKTDRAVGKRRNKEKGAKQPLEEAPDMLKTILDNIGVEGLSDDERMDYFVTGVVTGKYRASAYFKFLEDRGVDPNRVTRFFDWSFGTRSGASRVAAVAAGLAQGYSFEDMWERTAHIPSRYGPEATQAAAEEVKEALPHIATWTQTWFNSMHPEMDRVTLFRAIVPDEYERLQEGLDPEATSVSVGLDPISIWTTNKRVAEFRAKGSPEETRKGAVVTMSVPIDRLVHYTDAVDPTGRRFPEALVMTNPEEVVDLPKESLEEVQREKQKVLPPDLTIPPDVREEWAKSWEKWHADALSGNEHFRRQMEFRRRTYGETTPDAPEDPGVEEERERRREAEARRRKKEEEEHEPAPWEEAEREWRETRRRMGLTSMIKQETETETETDLDPFLWTETGEGKVFELDALQDAYSWIFEAEHDMFLEEREGRQEGENEIIAGGRVEEKAVSIDPAYRESPSREKPVEKTRWSKEEARKIGDDLGLDWDKTNFEEFQRGLEVELEHQDITEGDPVLTAKIVLAHLEELEDYYTRLEEMEGTTDKQEHANGTLTMTPGIHPASSSGRTRERKRRRLIAEKKGDEIRLFSEE